MLDDLDDLEKELKALDLSPRTIKYNLKLKELEEEIDLLDPFDNKEYQIQPRLDTIENMRFEKYEVFFYENIRTTKNRKGDW